MVNIYDPRRATYAKELQEKKDCYFCDQNVIDAQECTAFVYEGWMVLTNKYPYMDGNVMIVPRRHLENLGDISEREWEEFPHVLTSVQSRLFDMFETESMNIGINIGEESGRSVAHLHWQVIPRKRKNHTVVGMLADIQVITLSPEELKKRLSL